MKGIVTFSFNATEKEMEEVRKTLGNRRATFIKEGLVHHVGGCKAKHFGRVLNVLNDNNINVYNVKYEK